MKLFSIIAAIVLFSASGISAQNIVPLKNATKYIGHKVTICDMVYSSSHTSEGTLLYLGDLKQSLTLIIKTADLSKFKGHPHIDFKGKDIYITGVVINAKGKPEIVVSDPKQIKPYLVDSPVKQPFAAN